MLTKSSSIQKAEILTELLYNDLEALETDKPGNEKEPPLPKMNGSKSIISDEIVANGRAAVNEKCSGAAEKADGWDEPIPLEPPAAAQAFPIHCLPEPLRGFALSVAEHNQTSIDMPAVSSLGVASTCLQGKYLVQGKAGWTVPLSNYYLIIGKPAERKSSVCSIYEEPITAYESRMNKALALEIAQSENIRQVLEKELEALKSAAVKTKGKAKSGGGNKACADPYAEIEAKQAEINNHEDIKPLRLICGGDISLEALTSLLADNNGKMAMFNAEGGIFTILKGLYSQSPNIDTFLQAHCGDSIRVDRKGRQSEVIEKPCLTTLLFAQPDVLTEIVGNKVFRGRGLTARFLYSYPASTVGGRRYRTERTQEDVAMKYRRLVDDMLDIQQKEPQLITLSEEADALSEQFFNALEPRLGKDGDLEYMADWAGKLHGTVLRIAGLLHVVEGVSKNGRDFAHIPFESALCITGETMAAAVEIGNYFLSHAQVCYGYMGTDENIDKAKYILARLEKKKAAGDMRAYDIWRLCRSKQHKIEKVEDIKPCLQILEDYGYIRAMATAGGYDRGRPVADRYTLNPKRFNPANG